MIHLWQNDIMLPLFITYYVGGPVISPITQGTLTLKEFHMKKNKVQSEYKKALKEANKKTPTKSSGSKSLHELLFNNAFTRSKFFYYGIRILLIIAVIALAGQIDNLFYGFFAR